MHGFPAGGNADTIARVLATSLQLQLGQTFDVEAKAGAGGTIAADTAAKSKPDGYTLLLATGGHAIAAALNDKLPFDTVKSFQPVSSVTSFPFRSWFSTRAHYAICRTPQCRTGQPAPLNYGTAGIGTGQHMTGAFLAHKTGFNARTCPSAATRIR